MTTTSTNNLISLLLQDHAHAKQLFADFQTVGRSQWPEKFCELTETLVRHEVAEEEIVFPEVRKVLPDGDQLADARIAEQSRAEQVLAEMEKLDADDDKFRTMLEQLQMDVLAHAEQEEQTVFSRLPGVLDQSRLDELGQRYEKAKASAPTHPHPHAPDTPPGNLMMGPVAAMVDRLRDAIRKG
jgi:hemerythrin superfamily protein